MATRDEMIRELLDFHIWRLFDSPMDDLIDEYNDIVAEQDICDECREKQDKEANEGHDLE